MSRYREACPFCGSVGTKVKRFILGSSAEYRVVCSLHSCQAEGPKGLSQKEAIEKWEGSKPRAIKIKTNGYVVTTPVRH